MIRQPGIKTSTETIESNRRPRNKPKKSYAHQFLTNETKTHLGEKTAYCAGKTGYLPVEE